MDPHQQNRRGRWMMGIFSFISNLLSLTPAEEARHHELMVEMGIEDLTAEEKRWTEQEEIENYVDHIAGMGTWRSTWFTGDNNLGYTLHWKESVFDQNDREHVVCSGSHFVGYIADFAFNQDSDVIFGELIEDGTIQPKRKKLPVYMRMQGRTYE
jgi:hypothetical protein